MIPLLLCLGLGASVEPVQYQIDVKLFTGDPLGSRAEGTVKHLAEPRIVTRSGERASFRSGGEVAVKHPAGTLVLEPIGTSVEVLPTARPDGTILMDLGTTFRTVNARPGATGVPGFTERSVRLNRLARPGETFKVRIAAESPTDQTWVEVTVRPFSPAA